MVTAPDAQERIGDAVRPLAQRHGLELEDVTVAERSGRTDVRIVVDLPETRTDSVDLDTLAQLSREVSDLADADDALLGSGPSELEVTTPGVDRPLTAPRHFRRNRGRLLRLATTDGQEHTARLLAVEDPAEEATDSDGALLVLRPERPRGTKGQRRPARADQERLRLPLAQVDTARVEIEFSPPTDLADLPELADLRPDPGPDGPADKES